VSPLFLLMGLLVLAYIGSFVVGDRRIRGFGLPSGAEYLALGFLLGPTAFGLLDRSTLASFDPIAHVGLGWIALVIGLGFGVDRRRTTKPGHVFLGSFISLATAAIVAVPLYFIIGRLSGVTGESRILLVMGGAIVSAETTRESVRWVTERYGASGPISSLVSDIARSDDLVPLTVLTFVFSRGVTAHLPWAMSSLSWGGATLGLGVALGAVAAVIIGKDLRTDETWGTLLGITVLCAGLTTRLGLSTLSAMFAMGIALATMSGQREALLEMTEPTERTVLHPVLLLAGARVNIHAAPKIIVVVLVALVARGFGKWVVGLTWQAASPRAREAGPLLGFGLLSCGTLSMTVGLAFALHSPGVVGDTVLVIATCATVVGEFIGPYSLLASLRAAKEVPEGAGPKLAATP
jgi:Kef-type K+ transport system membrane component KefB